MTTETKAEKTETPAADDNKAVFGPLGKYAAVAVIMVSVIVTTAIMLDRQLQSVDEQIAAIEEEVASIHAAEASIPEQTAVVETAAANTETTEVEAIEKAADEAVAAIKASTETFVETPVKTPAATDSITTPVTETAVTQKAAAPVAATKRTEATAAPASQFEMAPVKNNTAQARQQQLAKENQARIEAYKQEQKQRLTEMFARIKALESQQLDRYKADQDSRVIRLREQISQQQQMIEALVLRNKELFELRAASMQRSQNNREQALNRI